MDGHEPCSEPLVVSKAVYSYRTTSPGPMDWNISRRSWLDVELILVCLKSRAQ